MNFIQETHAVLHDQLYDVIDAASQELENSDTVSSEMTSTNVSGPWDLEFEIEEIKFVSATEIRVLISFKFSGDQDDDKPFSGDEVAGQTWVTIDDQKNVRFEKITAARNI